jgi:hypothetical protein
MRVLATLVALVAVSPAAAPVPAPPPRTRTLVVASGPITAFAQNGHFVAWASAEPQSARCSMLVRIRDLSRGYQNAVTDAAGDTCRSDLLVSRLALGVSLDSRGDDAHALWLRYEAGNNQYWYLSTASLDSPHERRIADLVYPSSSEVRVSLIGAGPVLGYAWSAAGVVEENDCLTTGLPCPFRVLDGGEVRVGVVTDSPQPQIPPAAAAAASGERGSGRLALLVRGDVGEDTSPNAPLREIEVRSSSVFGPLVSRFTVTRPVRTIAVSSNTVAVLTDRAIERYTISGTLHATNPVPATTAPELSISTAGIVYHVGRSIRVVGRGQVAVAASAPIGLSIDGSRIAWAENVHVGAALVGRIRALDLPSRSP